MVFFDAEPGQYMLGDSPGDITATNTEDTEEEEPSISIFIPHLLFIFYWESENLRARSDHRDHLASAFPKPYNSIMSSDLLWSIPNAKECVLSLEN